jgi:hypothetical protein
MRSLSLAFFFWSTLMCNAQTSGLVSPEKPLQISTSDLDRFWVAFDAFVSDTTKNPFEAYVKNGSVGLRELWKYIEHPEVQLKRAVRDNISYYAKVRASSYSLVELQNDIENFYDRLKNIYPEAEKPVYYAVVGGMNSGGTSTESGVIIGTELFSKDSVVNGRGFKALSIERLKTVAAVGLIFYHQKPAHTGYNVLRQSIVHGSAEFLATLLDDDVKTQILNQKNYKYGETYEETLVKEFLRDKDSNDFRNWLHQGRAIDGRPADLGSWIGFKITEAYYNNAVDKLKAVDDILKINDFERFLTLSGYAEPFKY